MAFSKNNQFWKLRRQHGRKRKFESGQALMLAAEDYFQWCDENPLIKVQYVGSKLIRVEIPLIRVYTLSGLCLFLHLNPTYWRQMKASKTLDADLKASINRIEAIIWVQKFSGAAVGIFNPNIISRDLGLTSKRRSSQLVSVESITGMRIL